MPNEYGASPLPPVDELVEWDPARKLNVPAAVHGAAQGLSLGTSDEIESGARALYETATGPEELDEILKTYRNIQQKTVQPRYQEQQKKHPGSYIGGEMLGGAATTFSPAGLGVGLSKSIGSNFLRGVAGSAAYGAGSSEADLLSGDTEEYKKFGQDVGLEVGLDAALPGLATVFPFHKLRKMLGDSPQFPWQRIDHYDAPDTEGSDYLRIQNAEGRGPFDKLEEWSDTGGENPKHISPFSDDGLNERESFFDMLEQAQEADEGQMVYGFKNEEQLKKYISETELAKLKELGYEPGWVSSDYGWEGNDQVLFEPENWSQGGKWLDED